MADGSQAGHPLVSRTSGQTIPVASPHILTGHILTVGLATLPAEPPVRPVDLNDLDAVVEQVPGQAGVVAAGAFHPDQVKAAVASQPVAQLLVAAA